MKRESAPQESDPTEVPKPSRRVLHRSEQMLTVYGLQPGACRGLLACSCARATLVTESTARCRRRRGGLLPGVRPRKGGARGEWRRHRSRTSGFTGSPRTTRQRRKPWPTRSVTRWPGCWSSTSKPSFGNSRQRASSNSTGERLYPERASTLPRTTEWTNWQRNHSTVSRQHCRRRWSRSGTRSRTSTTRSGSCSVPSTNSSFPVRSSSPTRSIRGSRRASRRRRAQNRRCGGLPDVSR